MAKGIKKSRQGLFHIQRQKATKGRAGTKTLQILLPDNFL